MTKHNFPACLCRSIPLNFL